MIMGSLFFDYFGVEQAIGYGLFEVEVVYVRG